MRVLQQALRHSVWLRTFASALLVLSLSVTSPAFAQDDYEDEEDDFLTDDFLDDEEEEYEDDFLSDDFAETQEEAVVQEKGAYYWGFEVPVDVLILRPVGALDVAVGGMFVTFISVPLVLGAGIGSIVDAAQGEGWYFDTTNFDNALEQAVVNPSDFLFDRPLGQLVSY